MTDNTWADAMQALEHERRKLLIEKERLRTAIHLLLAAITTATPDEMTTAATAARSLMMDAYSP